MANSDNWRTVNVKKVLLEQIEKIVIYDEVKKQGITNISQFIDSALKDKIQELAQTRFNVINTHDDHLKILDNKIGKLGQIVSVYFRKNNDMWCDYCDEVNCVHVQYTKEIPHMKTNTKEMIIKKSPQSNFSSVVAKDTCIEIFDDGLRKGTPVKIIFDDKKLYCDECQSYNCNHVKHTWSIDHIAGQLEERGFTIVERTCPKCGTVAAKNDIGGVFGYRKSNGKTITQSWCRYCRSQERKNKKQNPKIDSYL